MKILAVIPSRYASTRFPGKPLVDIQGKPMIQWVYENASKAIENVFVATDDERIFSLVTNFGGKAVYTSKNHNTGTDRCAEALDKIKSKLDINFEIVLNIQGDEPLLQPEQITSLIDCFKDPKTEIATLIKKINDYDELVNPNNVKITFNKDFYAMYFSRSTIPCIRNAKDVKEWINLHKFYKHIGIYAFKSDILRRITKLQSSSLERAESLEQNRWLENGYKIKVIITEIENIGIDTPEDLKKLLK